MSEESHRNPQDPEFDEHAGQAAPEGKTPAQGNRPAEGAQRGLPGEVLTNSFGGSENAGDFLGLDLELASSLGEGLELATPAPPEFGGLELASPPGSAAAPAQDYDAEFGFDTPTVLVHVDDETRSDISPVGANAGHHDGLDGEDGYDDGELEDDDLELFDEDGGEQDAPGSRTKILVGAFAVGLMAVAAVTVGPRFLAEDDVPMPAPVPVAKGPRVADVEPAVAGTETDPLDAGTEAVPGAGTESDDPSDAGVELALDTTGGDVQPTTTDPEAGFAEDLLGALVEMATDESGSEPGSEQGAGTEPLGGAPVGLADLGLAEDVEFPDFDEGFEWVSEDQLDVVWRGTRVPMEAIVAPAKTVMPRVGNVRVVMNSGEVFEGRLFAVGQHRVWLDIDGGRLGLDGDDVAKIHQVTPEGIGLTAAGGPLVGAKVRVAVPGGSLYGRVLAQEGAQVTLVTPDGAKVTLEDAQIESLGSPRAIVVSR